MRKIKLSVLVILLLSISQQTIANSSIINILYNNVEDFVSICKIQTVFYKKEFYDDGSFFKLEQSLLSANYNFIYGNKIHSYHTKLYSDIILIEETCQNLIEAEVSF